MAAGGQTLPGVFQALLDHLQFIYEKFKGKNPDNNQL
jgi:hypothetical protein